MIDSCLMIKMPEEIDHYKSTYICENADKYILRKDVCHIVFDFSNTKFMDSSGIGMVLGRYRHMGESSGNMAIVGCSQNIRNILNMAGVFSIIDYYATKDEAVEQLNRKEVS